MKILIDARFYGRENTGLGRYTSNLIQELQKIDKSNIYVILLRQKYFDKLKLNRNWTKVLAEVPHYSIKEQFQIPAIIKKHNPDLVHFLHFNVPLNFSGNFITTIHDMTMHKWGRENTNLPLPFYLIKHEVYKIVFRHAVMKSKKIIVPSQYVKDEILSSFDVPKDKINVIYEGVSSLNPSSTPSKTNNLLYFLYVGNTYPHKNLENAIKAIVEINKKTNQKILLYIVSGQDKFSQRLKNKLSKLNAQDLVVMTGFVADEKLSELYENSVGFIYPSFTEGFGLPGLEAMNHKTPLLASNIPVFREIYGNHAIYFDPKDIRSITNALVKTLSLSKSQARLMITRNKEFAKKYSWSKMAQETLKIYNSAK